MNKDYWKAKAFSVGYMAATKNHDLLYYRRTGEIVFFLDFGNNKFKKIAKDVFVFPSTFKQLKRMVDWELNRKLNEEQTRLTNTNFNVYYDRIIDIDGYCKICSKDIQRNSKLCKNCREKQKPLFVEEAKHWLAKQINQTNACFICGKKLFCPIDKLIFDFSLAYYNKYFFNSVSDGYNVLNKLEKHFKLYDGQKFLIKHHLCYFDDFTIDVCPTCHARIHHSKDESYKQYKPVDKRILFKNGGD